MALQDLQVTVGDWENTMIADGVHQELLGNPATRAHVAHLYEDDEQLAHQVAEHLREGLEQDEALLVVATPEHWEAIAEDLDRSGADPSRLRTTGRLIVFDAVETLDRIMGERGPDPVQFQRIIGGALQNVLRITGAGRVRAYGELVDLLWQAGDRMGALRIERYWEGILLSYPVSLVCGYRTGLLDPKADPGDVEHICTRHADVLPAEGRRHLDQAVENAFEDVLGKAQAKALRPLIDAMIYPSRSFGRAERTIFWTRRNLPTRLDPLLQRARGRLQKTRPV